ncbi:MAG: hypothetical protein ACNA8L_04010 [Luteolibacter sp.]|jgi:Ca2+-binding EF-hand superfamily protein
MKSISPVFSITLAALAVISCASPSTDRIPETRIERQMIGLLEKFDRWDYNGDGRLTLDELGEASQASGIPAQDILAFYDTNQDGGISLAEAQAAYQRRVEQRP